MFDNSGNKVKRFALTMFWLGVIASFICAIVLGRLPNQWGEYEFNFLLFLIILAGGSITSYISSLFLSAFGECAEGISQLNEQMYTVIRLLKENTKSDNNTSPKDNRAHIATSGNARLFVTSDDGMTRCPECDHKQSASHKTCIRCGATIK